jgi:hypothetical protein
VGITPTGLAAADFNHDRRVDVAVGITNDNSRVAIYLGDGAGAFTVGTPILGGDILGVIALDLNGDGKVDLVTADYSNETVSFDRGNGRGTFTKTSYPLPTKPKTPFPYAITSGDFNEDGMPDLVTSDLGPGGVTVLQSLCH